MAYSPDERDHSVPWKPLVGTAALYLGASTRPNGHVDLARAVPLHKFLGNVVGADCYGSTGMFLFEGLRLDVQMGQAGALDAQQREASLTLEQGGQVLRLNQTMEGARVVSIYADQHDKPFARSSTSPDGHTEYSAKHVATGEWQTEDACMFSLRVACEVRAHARVGIPKGPDDADATHVIVMPHKRPTHRDDDGLDLVLARAEEHDSLLDLSTQAHGQTKASADARLAKRMIVLAHLALDVIDGQANALTKSGLAAFESGDIERAEAWRTSLAGFTEEAMKTWGLTLAERLALAALIVAVHSKFTTIDMTLIEIVIDGVPIRRA
jgi:hypothetical protein